MWEWVGDTARFVTDTTTSVATTVGSITVDAAKIGGDGASKAAVYTAKKIGDGAAWTFDTGIDATVYTARKTGEGAIWTFENGMDASVWSLKKSGEAIAWTYNTSADVVSATGQGISDTCIWLDQKLMGCAEMGEQAIDAASAVAMYCFSNQDQCKEIAGKVIEVTQGFQ